MIDKVKIERGVVISSNCDRRNCIYLNHTRVTVDAWYVIMRQMVIRDPAIDPYHK